MFLHNLNIHLPLLALDEGLLITPKGIYVKVPQPKQSDSLHLALKSSNPHGLPESILQLPVKNGEFKHEVRQFEKSYDNQQAEQISLMV